MIRNWLFSFLCAFLPPLLALGSEDFPSKKINQDCQCKIDELGQFENFSLNINSILKSRKAFDMDPEKQEDRERANKYIGKMVSIESFTFGKPLELGFTKGMVLGCEGTRGKLISVDRQSLVLEVNGKRKTFILTDSYSTKHDSGDFMMYRYHNIKNYMRILPLN